MISHKDWRVSEYAPRLSCNPGIRGGTASVGGVLINWVRGAIRSTYAGLLRTGARVRIIDGLDVRVKWPAGREPSLSAGKRVLAAIPVEAVRLEAGLLRRSRQRWNRWIGRIVLVERREAGVLYTVKIHGADWTIQGYGPVAGAHGSCQSWDAVNVVVDPQSIELAVLDPQSYDNIVHSFDH